VKTSHVNYAAYTARTNGRIILMTCYAYSIITKNRTAEGPVVQLQIKNVIL